MTTPTGDRTGPTSAAIDRRRHIVEKAALLFDRFGYHNTSMEQIAEEIGIAKPSLYHYFRGKTEILFEIDLALHETLLPSFDEVGVGSSAVERLRRAIRTIINGNEARPGFLRVLMEYRSELPPRERAVVRRQAAEVYNGIKAALEEGIAGGELRPVDTSVAALAILGTSVSVYRWYRANGRLTNGEIADMFADFLLNGLVSSAAAEGPEPPIIAEAR
jgi:TetR/AcrR family transcriptional regulator, cholesterol catabolism regulator